MRSKWKMGSLVLLICPLGMERLALADGCACDGDGDIGVETSVGMSCTVETTELAFGAYDPIVTNAAASLDATGGLVVHCSDNHNATIILGQGNHPFSGSSDAAPLRQMSDGGTSVLHYFIYQDAARTVTWGNTFETAACTVGNITVYGRIPGGQNAAVGTYTDVILVTVLI